MKALNNKGYTLVELLLSIAILAIVMAQVANIMYSTTLIYKNGNRDISLQTEAQQIVAMVEELVMDCDGKVTFNSTSNTITIDNKASWMTDYTITLNDDKLYLAAAGGNPQLMADGVKSIDMDLSNYEHESKVYFTVEMENESSEYASSKDIYLRNHIGKNDSGIGQYSKPQEADSEIETLNGADVYPMEILRFKNYDLSTEIPEDVRTKYNLQDCTFQPVIWGTKPDGTEGYIVRDVYPYYEIDATGTKISSNQDLNKSYKGTETLGTEDGNDGYVLFQSTKNPNFLLKCYSVDVCIGTQAYKNSGTESISLTKVSGESCSILSYETCYSGTKVPMYIGVSGISLEECQSFSLTPYIKFTGDKLSASTKSDANFYKVTYDDKIITPTADIILKNYVVDSENDDEVYGSTKYNDTDSNNTHWKGYTNNSVCISLDTTFTSDSNKQIKTINSKQIAVYVAKGYDDATANTFGASFDYKYDGAEYYPFKISFNSGSVQYGADSGKEGMFIDKDSNCFVVATKMLDFSQGKIASGGCGIPSASKFYEMGGEIFFDLEVKYDNGTVLGAAQTASFDGKVLLNPYDSNKGHSDKEMSSDASKKLSEAVVSGKTANVKTVEYDVLKADGTESGDKVSVPVYSNSSIK